MENNQPLVALALILALIIYSKKSKKTTTPSPTKGETIVTPTTVPLLTTTD